MKKIVFTITALLISSFVFAQSIRVDSKVVSEIRNNIVVYFSALDKGVSDKEACYFGGKADVSVKMLSLLGISSEMEQAKILNIDSTEYQKVLIAIKRIYPACSWIDIP